MATNGKRVTDLAGLFCAFKTLICDFQAERRSKKKNYNNKNNKRQSTLQFCHK